MEEPDTSRRKEVVNFFLDRKMVIGQDVLSQIGCNFSESDLYSFIQSKINDPHFMFLNTDLLELIQERDNLDMNWSDMERFKALQEKGTANLYTSFISVVKQKSADPRQKDTKAPGLQDNLKVVTSFEEVSQKFTIQDFVMYFNVRYNSIKKLLENRQELQGITSINRILYKKEREPAATVGIVSEKRETQNGNIILSVEDPTGSINVLVNKNRQDLYAMAKEIVMDEIIGVVGVSGGNIIFANNILIPDVPVHKEMKKSPEDEYAVFLSDIHVGSNNFLPSEFNKFLSWISGETGNDEQREISSKVKYLFIVGDLVDGVGIYPGQEDELVIRDVVDQYRACAELLKKIPKHIKIVVCPGNHDAVRISEPQPRLAEEFSGCLTSLPNVVSVSNPAMINIGATKDFPGFDVLIYHGYSFDYYVANVDTIREQGGYDRADLIMKFLLQRRHLAPTHTSTLYIPLSEKDPLVIEKIPDFFITGHIHKAAAANYRNITMICGSCWQSKTAFQEKVGHNPEPARVPVVNLKTRKVKMLRF